jgi:hypothetical protein
VCVFVRVCVCICVCVCVRVCGCLCMCLYIYAFMCVFSPLFRLQTLHVYIHTHIHTCVRAHPTSICSLPSTAHTHKHTYTYINTPAHPTACIPHSTAFIQYMHACMHTCSSHSTLLSALNCASSDSIRLVCLCKVCMVVCVGICTYVNTCRLKLQCHPCFIPQPCMYMRVRVCVCVCVCVFVHGHLRINASLSVCLCACARIDSETCTHAYAHI